MGTAVPNILDPSYAKCSPSLSPGSLLDVGNQELSQDLHCNKIPGDHPHARERVWGTLLRLTGSWPRLHTGDSAGKLQNKTKPNTLMPGPRFRWSEV